MWSLDEAMVVGGTRPYEGRAPFARAAVVLSRTDAPERFLIVKKYHSATKQAEGTALTAEEWQALQDTGQALSLDEPISPARTGGVLWIMRENFGAGREKMIQELRRGGVLFGAPSTGPDNTVACYVDEPEATAYRVSWGKDAFDRAWRLIRDERLEPALERAELAFVLDSGMSAERVALLSCICDRLGRKTRSEGYIEMARRSRGDEFSRLVSDKMSQFLRDSYNTLPPRPRAPKERERLRKGRERTIIQSMASLRREAA